MSKLKTPDICWVFSREDHLRKESLVVFTFPHSISEAVVVIMKDGEVVNAFPEKSSSPRLGKPLLSLSTAIMPLLDVAVEAAKVVTKEGYHPEFTDVLLVTSREVTEEEGVKDVYLFDPKTGAQLEIVLNKEDEPVSVQGLPPRCLTSQEMPTGYRSHLHLNLQRGNYLTPSDKMRELLHNYHLLLG